jgi:hypothetical protein
MLPKYDCQYVPLNICIRTLDLDGCKWADWARCDIFSTCMLVNRIGGSVFECRIEGYVVSRTVAYGCVVRQCASVTHTVGVTHARTTCKCFESTVLTGRLS